MTTAVVTIRPVDRVLPLKIEQTLRRIRLDKWNGNLQLNIKDGRIHGFHVHEVVVLTAPEIL